MVNIKKLVSKQKDLVIKIRRDLHRIPETAYMEKKTSAYVTEYMRKEGLRVTTGIAQYGVVGLMETGRPGPTLMIRADMDALPITEKTKLLFASIHDGAMHACGHDGHMAMVLVALTVLSRIKSQFKGNIKFLFQPAEEGPGGAKPMIEEGVMDNPIVDYSIGCHVWQEIPAGSIGVRSGQFMAAMGRFDIKIKGKGGHGAMPHLSIDSLEIGVQVICALQRIVSRKMNPLSPSVITVGSFHAGTAFNVIPGEAEMCGTTRTFDRDVWHSWEERMNKVISGVCKSMDADYELVYTLGYPPTVNDKDIADVVRHSAILVVGKNNVVTPERTMGGEDMAFYLEKSKGCFFCLGVGKEEGGPIHSPYFDFNDSLLINGVETYCRVAIELLK